MDFVPVITVLGTLGGTALGSWITHGLARRRTLQDKIWDQRREAYSQIVFNLNAMVGFSSSVASGYEDDASSFYHSKTRDKLITDMWQKWRDLRTVRSSNILIISEDFRDALSNMTMDVVALTSDPDGEDVQYIDDLLKVLRSYEEKLTQVGSRELMNAAGQKR